LAFVLFRDGLQIIQGVIRVGADSSVPTPRSPRSRTPVPSSDAFDSGSTSATAVDGEIVEVNVAHQGVTEEMVRWAEKLPLETLVLVEGRVQSPQADSHGEHNAVRSANVHGAEVEVTRVCPLASFLILGKTFSSSLLV
jgi:aspartyl/asparaginyl-tRNA synthetase